MIVELCKMHKKCDKKRDIMTEMIFHVDKMKEKTNIQIVRQSYKQTIKHKTI